MFNSGDSYNLAKPPEIGGTTPNSGKFTTIQATGSVSLPTVADATLSGPPVLICLKDENADISYYFKAYPVKA